MRGVSHGLKYDVKLSSNEKKIIDEILVEDPHRKKKNSKAKNKRLAHIIYKGREMFTWIKLKTERNGIYRKHNNTSQIKEQIQEYAEQKDGEMSGVYARGKIDNEYNKDCAFGSLSGKQNGVNGK